MIACLDLHDFSANNQGLELLGILRDYFDDFRVSLFTVPTPGKIEVKDWMQFIPHGLDHKGSEARRWDYAHFKHEIIPEVEKRFENLGLPITEGFCAPHWNWNEDVVKTLNDIGWWGAISPYRTDMPSPDRYYIYDYAINEPFWKDDRETLKLHGHLGCTKDDLALCMDNLLKLPEDTEWKFVTEFIDETV